ncbi:hypothetical protein [sulfur-oxidizing endosymbiont of Gigantopelta aegis]|uniref:hypothetical protein n=1 Tax=sulfur-oxidizing endosymbiont of Gigantopelta aegis TaxID=2794934 RepID=UPI0018DB59F5|nr:hypothetical protein [sulfur-oxidizing endosymbiont of Gigantopelta aegis]
MKNVMIFSMIALILTLSACGGGGADVVTNTTNTTMGQELIDLDASFKKGLLTESEYKKAKKNIMNRYDN